MRLWWIACCAVSCVGWLVCGSASAFVLTGQNWRYQTHPMGEDWRVCTTGMPGSGGQRTKDGATEWNYAHFTFPFGADACLSGGVYPTNNNVNQVDFGGGLGAGVLAETTWFFVPSTGDIVECDMRFSNAVTWYTGIGTPPPTQFDWWSVAAHEMGHCVGLNHEDAPLTPTPVMASVFAPGEVRRTLTADDRAGRNAIYGIVGGSDVDSDGVADLVVWRPSDGGWYVLTSSSGFSAHFFRQWGLSGDIPVGGSDVDSDGVADLVVWRPSDGGWYVLTSSSGFSARFFRQWGLSDDIPVGGSDVDGDGITDLVVWRPSDGGWYVLTSSSGFSARFFRQWGLSDDIPVGGSDVDGDGVADLVVWRPSDGVWYVLTSSSGFSARFFRQWGLSGDIPVGGSDVDGDGVADLVVWRPSDGVWYVLTSSSGLSARFFRQWGLSGDIPVGGSDVDGDGVADLVVWRPSDGVWYVLTSSSGFSARFFRQWGLSGDIPVGGSGDTDRVTRSLEAGLTLSAQ